jgi:hypothetical protein
MRLEQMAELKAAAVDAALGSGEADVERRRDLFVRKSGQISQHNRLSVLERELRKRTEHSRAEVVRFGRRLRKNLARDVRRAFVRDRLEARGRVLPTACARERCVDADPVEPGEECGLGAVAVEVPPRLYEHVLHSLFDVTSVVEDAQEHDAETALVAAHDLCEGVEVSLLSQSHKLGIGLLIGHDFEIVRSGNEATGFGV